MENKQFETLLVGEPAVKTGEVITLKLVPADKVRLSKSKKWILHYCTGRQFQDLGNGLLFKGVVMKEVPATQ